VAVRVSSRTAALIIKIKKKMEKKLYVAPMQETIKLNYEAPLLADSDPLEEPSMGGSDAGYTDPSEFKP
jgi:hypothetical protein